MSDFDLLVLKTIKDNPDLNADQLFEIMFVLDNSSTLNNIKNSIKRNLFDLCEFKGAKRSGGYYLSVFEK